MSVGSQWLVQWMRTVQLEVDSDVNYPLVNIQKAIEHDHLQLIYPLKMLIFHSHVSLPEGMLTFWIDMGCLPPIFHERCQLYFHNV